MNVTLNGTDCISFRGEIAKKIASLPLEKEGLSRTVIITQGADPVIVVENGLLREFPVSADSAITSKNFIKGRFRRIVMFEVA